MAEGCPRLVFSFGCYRSTELFYEFISVLVDLFRGPLQGLLCGGFAFHSQRYDGSGEEWMGKIVACPVNGLVLEERVLHEMAESMAFSFYLNLEESFGFFHEVNFQLGTFLRFLRLRTPRLIVVSQHLGIGCIGEFFLTVRVRLRSVSSRL